MRLAKSVTLILLLAFMSTAFSAPPGRAESTSWSEPVAIGDDLGGQGMSLSSAANMLGQMVAAWGVWLDDSTAYVFANRYMPGEGWNGPEVIAEDPGVGECAVGIDDSGNCLVVWAQGPSIQSSTYKVGVGWEPAVQVASSSTARWFYDVKLAVAPDGAGMAIWRQDNQEAYGPFYAAYKPAGGNWQEPEEFQSTSSTVMNVRLANDGMGNFLAAFTLYDGERWGVWANSFAPAAGWGKEVRIESQAYNAYDLNIAINRAGYAVVVWQQFGYPDWNSPTAFANRYSPEDGWGTEGPIEELNSGGCDPPVVSVDEAGNAVSIWRRVSVDMTASSLRTNTYTAGVGWGSPATLEGSLSSIDEHISVGIVGSETFTAWIRVGTAGDNESGYELVANHFNMTAGWEEPVTITTDNMSAPSVTADNLGGAAIFWYRNVITPNVFVSQYLSSTTPSTTVIASVDIKPDTLNMKAAGKYLTAYIELPEGYDVGDIQLDSIRLNGQVPVTGTCDIGDYDKDKVDDLMVKFDFSQVFGTDSTIASGQMTMTVSGELADGTLFEGSDAVTIVSVNASSTIVLSILGFGVPISIALVLALAAGISACAVLMWSSRRKTLRRK